MAAVAATAVARVGMISARFMIVKISNRSVQPAVAVPQSLLHANLSYAGDHVCGDSNSAKLSRMTGQPG